VSEPLLQAWDLGASLGRRRVLHDVSLALAPGSFTAVVGPNGAGKSTLLRALAGVIPVTGRLVRHSPLAYLAQDGSIAWPMPVRDVVALGRRRFGGLRSLLSPADAEAIEAALTDCGLTALADAPATDLSGGETARVLLARALAVRAPLLLLDEPVAALDPAHQVATMDLLARERRQGHAVVTVLHDLGLALHYADRMLVVADGRIVADAPPQELLTSRLLDRVFGIALQTQVLADGTRVTGFRRGSIQSPLDSASPAATTGPHPGGEAWRAPTKPSTTS
jgi:iron complex transport system ATP-binding protein